MSVPIVVAISAGAVALALPVMVAAQSVVAREEVTSAADAAALAAADAELGLLLEAEPAPCEAAQLAAAANGAHLLSCDLGPGIAEARVVTEVRLGLLRFSGRARAGVND